MTPEHEKLLSQLFVTWDITNGIVPRDFGFVQCVPRGDTTITFKDIPDGIPYLEKWFTNDQFEDDFTRYLQRLCGSTLPLSERERLDSIEFDLGMGKIRAPGPIGVHVVKRGVASSPDLRVYTHILMAFQGRFEVVR